VIRYRAIQVGAALALSVGASDAQARRVLPGRWMERTRVEELDGKVFMRIDLIAVSGSTLLVYDGGEPQLLGLSLGAEVRWRFGRKGGGPGEFGGITDLKGDGKGNAYLLDPAYSRVTVVRDDGTLARTIGLDRQLHRIGVTPAGAILGAPLSDALLLAVEGSAGLPSALSVPGEMVHLRALQRENRVDVSASGTIVVTHRWSSVVLVVSKDLATIRTFSLLDPQPFPELKTSKMGTAKEISVTRIDPEAKQVVRATLIVGDTLLVVDARRNNAAVQYIDAYSLRGGTYLNSRIIPEYPRALSAAPGRIYAVVGEPVPAVLIWEWTPARPGK
jgi:hypothetical protein